MRSGIHRTRNAIAAGALLVAVVGCGGSDDDGTSSSVESPEPAESVTTEAPGDAATPGSGDSALADAVAATEANYLGTFREPSGGAPAPAEAATVWLISCGEAAEGCAQPGVGAKQAADELGWDLTVFDGRLDPARWAQGVDQAIAAQADAIVLASIDCVAVRAPLQRAKDAGIKIYGLYAFDCDDPSVGGDPLFDGSTDYGAGYGRDYGALLQDFGASLADYAIATTEGDARVLSFKVKGFLFADYIIEGFDNRIGECSGCATVGTIEYLATDLGPNLTSKAQAALIDHPDANVVAAFIDTGMQFIAPAIVSGGVDVLSIGGEGLPANFGLIREDRGQDAILAGSPQWIGWAAIDGVVRLLAGEQVADSGTGWQLVTRDRNLPTADTPYEPPIDFRAAYRASWGLAGE